MKITISVLATLTAACFLTCSCRKKELPVYNTHQIIIDIKEQTGITLSTNVVVLEAGDGRSRRDDFYAWLVFLKSPETIQIPQNTNKYLALIEVPKVDPTTVRLVEEHLDAQIANPIATSYEVWDAPVGQCKGALVRAPKGDYLYLQRFANSTFMATNAPAVPPK